MHTLMLEKSLIIILQNLIAKSLTLSFQKRVSFLCSCMCRSTEASNRENETFGLPASSPTCYFGCLTGTTSKPDWYGYEVPDQHGGLASMVGMMAVCDQECHGCLTSRMQMHCGCWTGRMLLLLLLCNLHGRRVSRNGLNYCALDSNEFRYSHRLWRKLIAKMHE